MRWLNSFLPITAVAFILYATTTAPSILTFFDDSLEFQLVAPTLGIAHPTGYPLYTLLGALWSRVLFPVGNWAWRMNLLSALTAAIAIGLHFQLALRLIQGHTISAIANFRQCRVSYLSAGAATAALALLPVWWQQATVAEVYALHGLFVATILLATIAVRQTAINVNREQQSRSLTRLALLIGLSLTHHRMTVLLLPGIGLYLLWIAPSILRPQRAWLLWLLALTMPLLLYAYIPLRGAMGATDLHGSYQNTFAGFFAHVNASTYTAFLGWNNQALQIFRQQFSWWGILWGIGGGAATLILAQPNLTRTVGHKSLNRFPVRSRSVIGDVYPGDVASVASDCCANTGPATSNTAVGLFTPRNTTSQPEWLLIWVTFLIALLFGLFYNVEDVAVFLIPAFLCWTLFTGGGLCFFFTLIVPSQYGGENIFREVFFTSIAQSNEASPKRSPLSLWLCGTIAFFIGVSPLLYNDIVNRSQNWRAHDQAVALSKVAFPLGSHVVGLEGEATAIKYMQQAEGAAQAATALWANQPDKRFALVQKLMSQGTPLFLTQEVAGIEAQYSFTGEGPLIRVWPRGQVVPREPQRRLDLSLMDGALWLDGVDVNILEEAGGPKLRVAYYWRATQQLTRRIKLSLRLQKEGQAVLDASGHEMVSDRFPLRQATYSELWVPGEQIWDVQYVDLPQESAGNFGWFWHRQLAPPIESLELNSIIYDANSIEEFGRILIPIQMPPKPQE